MEEKILELIKATIKNNSIILEYDYNKNQIMYVMEGFSYNKGERRIGFTFEQLYQFYKQQLSKTE